MNDEQFDESGLNFFKGLVIAFVIEIAALYGIYRWLG